MENKFSIVINAQESGYVAVLRCTDAEGVQVDSQTLTGLADIDAAMAAAQAFITKNQN